ncbi:MAG: cytochrome c3 family protein, partial [Gallionella sp.]
MGATAKPGGHISTVVPCSSCHLNTAWLPASFSHPSVVPGTCATCHNGTKAKGKPSGHVATTAACDTCHRTTAWLP